MPRVFTYSFEDTTVNINHPGFENYSAYGTGIGSLSITFNTNNSSHSIAADKTVVVSKVTVHDGSVSFTVLQNSDFHKWLKRWADFIENAATSQFALSTLDITNKSTGASYHCVGVTHQKKPDEQFQSTAQDVTWTLMCADISTTNN